MSREIKLVISDFDGTLVDTKEANFLSYRDVLLGAGYKLTAEEYHQCFGLRFEEFMHRLGILDEAVMKKIRVNKAKTYPSYFNKIRVNQNLAQFIESFRQTGGKTALASTAARHNILNVLAFVRLNDLFDAIISGDEIARPKPDPACYIEAMRRFAVRPHQCLIFEDAPIGIEAASASGASYIIVKGPFHGN